MFWIICQIQTPTVSLIAAHEWPKIALKCRGTDWLDMHTLELGQKWKVGERVGETHEAMKTALDGGNQHRKKDVNDSGGRSFNNARLLSPSVPMLLSLFYHPIHFSLPHTSTFLFVLLSTLDFIHPVLTSQWPNQ